MKVYIGPYIKWVGPYQIAEKLLFWLDNDDDKVFELGQWLSKGWVGSVCEWLYSKRKRNVEIRIDDYDVWNMDTTLAHIIVPMLKLLRDKKHGAPYIDTDDVPECLHSEKIDEYGIDDKHFERWNYVIGEMMFAFESKTYDWEDQFHTGNIDFVWEKNSDGDSYTAEHGPQHTHTFDEDGWKAMNARIENGFRLFGKYYSGLWT
jgi:hypothetical protein